MNEAIIAAVASGASLLIREVVAYLLARRKVSAEESHQKRADDRAEADQALGMYKDLIATLKTDIERMNSCLRELEDERVQCREENAGLKVEIRSLKQRVAVLEKGIGGK